MFERTAWNPGRAAGAPRLSERVAATVRSIVADFASRPAECAADPERHFTRRRGLPLVELIWLVLTWGFGTIAQ